MRKVDLFIGTISSIIFLFFLMNIDKFVYGGIPGSISPVLLPKLITMLIVFLSIIMVGISLFKNNNIKDNINKKVKSLTDEDQIVSQKFIALYIGILFSYFLLLYLFGFMLSTPFVMFAIMFILGGRNMKVILPLVIICPPLLYYLCYHFLRVMLPQGLIFA